MKKILCTFVLSLVAVQFADAVDAARKAGPAKPAVAPVVKPSKSTPAVTVAVAPLELKNKSEFATENNSRDPFWPIGWKPAL